MVQITISTAKGDVIQLDVDSAEHIENVKALVEVETGIPLQQQVVFFNGKQLLNSNQLDKVGVKNGDLLFVQINQTASRGAPQGAQQQSIDPVEFQNYVKSNPQILQQLLHSNPPLAEAVLSDDLTLLTNLLSQQDQARRQAEAERLRKIEAMNADPLNPEYQKLIAEEIRMENINENMETAMEHIPESFARVVMLYIDCQVNNTPVKAFVDSGAQQTIMSVQCAERCGIMRLVDTRYQGIAKGVGTAKIVGRVHLAPIKIGNNFFPCSFTILEDRSMEFLLGLDMLRRHQCAIDLKDNVLRIGDEKVPFLAEKDIPLSELFSGQDALDSEGMNPTSVSNNPPKPTPTPTPAPSTTAPKPASIPQLAPQPQPQMQPPNRPTPVSFPEDTITQLMGLGFTRDEVVNALRQTRGNADAAASLLFGGGF